MLSFRQGETIYAQGDAADALFVIQKGRVKLSVRSHAGKEAILDLLSDGDFVGKDSLAGQSSRTASASAMTACSLLRIKKKTMLLALTRQVKLANLFWGNVLGQKSEIPAGFSGPALQSEREKTGAYSPAAGPF